jgi:predicted AlkP superfamily pyrophosphatase or phosphodiesterase
MKAISFVLLFCSTLILKAQSPQKSNYLVVLSLDGFRWDYPAMYHTPNLDSIAKIGVKAHSLIPSFPSVTFPNHYSIVTGLYPDNHGIINNTFNDNATGTIYNISDRKAVEDPHYYGGEPIWVTAHKNGITTASYFFVGSETPIQNTQPTVWKPYDKKDVFASRIDSVVAWLQKPVASRPRLITFYNDEPDHAGHTYGPESEQTQSVVEEMDSLIGIFYQKINKLPIADSINIIVLSDHGMSTTSLQKSVVISSVVPDSLLDYCLGYNPFYLVQPKKEYGKQVYESLSKLDGIWVWRKSEIPKELHYGNNKNVSDIVVCAKPGWSVFKLASQIKIGGAHGYTPDVEDMHAIFYASGPDFKKDFVQPSFKNIEIYNLLCKLLLIEPAANDGEIRNIENLLSEQAIH